MYVCMINVLPPGASVFAIYTLRGAVRRSAIFQHEHWQPARFRKTEGRRRRGVIKFRIFFKFLRFRSHNLARVDYRCLRLVARRTGKERDAKRERERKREIKRKTGTKCFPTIVLRWKIRWQGRIDKPSSISNNEENFF